MNGNIMTALIIGLLAREWFQLMVIGFNWLGQHRRKEEFMLMSKKNLDAMKRSGIIEDYEILSYDFTHSPPICHIKTGSKSELSKLRIVED